MPGDKDNDDNKQKCRRDIVVPLELAPFFNGKIFIIFLNGVFSRALVGIVA